MKEGTPKGRGGCRGHSPPKNYSIFYTFLYQNSIFFLMIFMLIFLIFITIWNSLLLIPKFYIFYYIFSNKFFYDFYTIFLMSITVWNSLLLLETIKDNVVNRKTLWNKVQIGYSGIKRDEKRIFLMILIPKYYIFSTEFFMIFIQKLKYHIFSPY